MINWNEYFDHIFVISRCKNFDKRENIDRQFKKLNITNYQYWYMPDYNLENSKIFKYNTQIDISRQRCTLAHYSLWKTCYELNYDNVLIIEDDAIFIEDEDNILNMLNIYSETKYDTNIYMFDYILFDKCIYFNVYFLGTCYVVDKRGLQYLINCHEKYNLICDNYFYDFNKNFTYISFEHTINNYYANIFFTPDDISINLKVSPVKICYQLDKLNITYDKIKEIHKINYV